MARHGQPRLVPLTEAAELTQRTTSELRRWCATGRLRCDRVGGDWYVLEDDLQVASGLRNVATRASERAVLSIAFPDERLGRRAFEQLRNRYRLGAENLGMAPLALDGAELVLVAGVFPADAVDEILEVAHACGGVVVDGVDEARITPARWRSPEEQGRSSYG